MSLEKFFQIPKWGSPVEIERRNRIKLSIYAYAYEMDDSPLVSDEVFDSLSKKINPSMSTGHKKMDKFFATEFHPDTGMWIHKHPELEKLKKRYEESYKRG